MKIFLTTSRRPSRRTRSFSKDLAFIVKALRFNRGKSSIEGLISKLGEDDKLIIIDTKKGNPSRLRIYSKKGLIASYLIRKVKLLRETKLDFRKIKKFSISIKDDFSKELSHLLGIESSDSYDALLELDEGEIEGYRALFIKVDSKSLGPIFHIKKYDKESEVHN